VLRSLRALVAEIFDPDRDGPLRPSRRNLAAFALYVAAAAVYVAIGLTTVDFLLSFWVALVYLLIAVWLIPLAVRRIL
jgi:hypothetical protein